MADHATEEVGTAEHEVFAVAPENILNYACGDFSMIEVTCAAITPPSPSPFQPPKNPLSATPTDRLCCKSGMHTTVVLQ